MAYVDLELHEMDVRETFFIGEFVRVNRQFTNKNYSFCFNLDFIISLGYTL